jgi:hypothetical protein
MSVQLTSSQSAQSTTAHSLIRSGLSLQLAGLLWGLAVQATPYPRLALTAHIQLMAEGAMVLLAGLVLLQTSVVQIGMLQCQLVYWGFAGVWVSMVAECVNAFWGTNHILPIVSYPWPKIYMCIYFWMSCGILRFLSGGEGLPAPCRADCFPRLQCKRVQRALWGTKSS